MRHSVNRTLVLRQRAALMRSAPTASEAKLFEALRGGKLGVTFRRQVPLAGRFIADLYASEVKLVVEVDGGWHDEREHADGRRDRALVRLGVRVLRVSAALAMSDLPAAVERVRGEVERLRGHHGAVTRTPDARGATTDRVRFSATCSTAAGVSG